MKKVFYGCPEIFNFFTIAKIKKFSNNKSILWATHYPNMDSMIDAFYSPLRIFECQKKTLLT